MQTACSVLYLNPNPNPKSFYSISTPHSQEVAHYNTVLHRELTRGLKSSCTALIDCICLALCPDLQVAGALPWS